MLRFTGNLDIFNKPLFNQQKATKSTNGKTFSYPGLF